MTYQLTRRLPDGTVKRHSMPFPRMRDAAKAAAYVLADNGAAPRRDAAAFASRLQDAPAGTELSHPSGYAFTITQN